MQANQSPLVGKFDLDPGRWRPMWYGVNIDIPILDGGSQQGSFTINNQPALLTRITHGILGRCYPFAPITPLWAQDGQYLLEFKDESSSYQNIPIQAALMFGQIAPCVGGIGCLDLPYPIPYSGSRTLTFRVTNLYPRTNPDDREIFTVQIVGAFIADWGPVASEVMP